MSQDVTSLEDQLRLAHKRIYQLEETLNQIPAERPTTTQSEMAARQKFFADVYMESDDILAPEPKRRLIEKHNSDERWLLSSIRNRCTIVDRQCWIPENAPSRPGHYAKLNLRRTRVHQESEELIGGQFYFHHLCLLAAGRVDEFLNIGHGTLQASHLCHNPLCCNADHIVVEPGEDNAARSSCIGHYEVVVQGTTYHSCYHWQYGIRKRCILPVIILTPGTYKRNTGWDT